MKEKEFLIKKISDQKDGFKEGYEYYRVLPITEEGLPTEDALYELLSFEVNKNVTFFIGNDKISIVSFVSDFKYKRNTLKEYKKNWCDNNLNEVKVRTFYKHFEYLKELIPNIQEIQRVRKNEISKTR